MHRSFSNCSHGEERNIATLFADDGSFFRKKDTENSPRRQVFLAFMENVAAEELHLWNEGRVGKRKEGFELGKRGNRDGEDRRIDFYCLLLSLFPFRRWNYDRKTRRILLFYFHFAREFLEEFLEKLGKSSSNDHWNIHYDIVMVKLNLM